MAPPDITNKMENMDKDKNFHKLVRENGVNSAIKEYYSNFSYGQVKAVTRHANELVNNDKILF